MTERAGVLETVTAALRTRGQSSVSAVGARRALTDYLESELDAAGRSEAAARVTSLPTSEFCDLRIGTTTGIKLYSEFTTTTARTLRLLAWRGDLPYDHLVLFGQDLPEKHRDTWRIAETRIATADSPPGVQQILFVRNTDGDTSTTETERNLWHYGEPVTALLLVVVGAGVVGLQLDYGIAVLTAIVTILVALVLLAIYGLLRERST